MRVTLIQCTNTKRSGTHKARNLYDESNYFCIMRDWARSTGNPWFILSAKHGLLDPMREIEEYNEVGLSVEQCEQIATELSDKGVEEVLITAGKKYTDPLTPELEANGIDVVEVARGMRIGKRVKHLKEKTRELENHTL